MSIFTKLMSLLIAGGISTATVFVTTFVSIFVRESLQPFAAGYFEIRIAVIVLAIVSVAVAIGLGCDLAKRKKAQPDYSGKLDIFVGLGSVVLCTVLINLALHFSVAIARLWNYPIAIGATWLVLWAVIWLGLVAFGMFLKGIRRSH